MEEDDAIAIVGVGCRFPGAQNLEEFWEVLKNGENHVIDVPKERWNVSSFYDPDPDAPGKTYVRKVGIVHGHDMFDNQLFEINDIEASKMDPQQRFILESTFMALEDGGFPRSELSGSHTGVYIGLMNSDYKDILGADANDADNYTLTGAAASIAAARVSYVFNLLGPAMTIDTACSSSLIAMHLASQALRLGDCNMAICGGVNCVLTPSVMIPLSKARMVSPSGASRAFSADADGYARGEGCGILILKRLKDAKENGDHIWAIVKTASNQDGRMASPITAPSGQQQEALLRAIYTRYDLNTADIQYIEAHGTGTPVGDPIEVNSLGKFFSPDGMTRFIGSVKTNLGHLESAAGVAGLIKVLLMMKNELIVPSLHFSSPNPQIDFDKLKLKVPVQCEPWKSLPDGRRLSCVNSFGYGGSNAHAVLIQGKFSLKSCNSSSRRYTIIAISGNTKKAFRNNVASFIKLLAVQNVDYRLLSYTSTCRRDHYTHRVAVPVDNADDLSNKLKTLSMETFGKQKIRIILVFCGMGTQWSGMCQQLMDENEIFLNTIRNIDEILHKYSSISLEREFREQGKINDPVVGPLLLFACQVGLFTVWKSWGIQGDAVVGQSVGEVAAAFASGRISLEDAVKIIFHRTDVLSAVTGGSMLAILNYPVSEIEQICSSYKSRVNVSLYYSPTSCAISGENDLVEAVRKTVQENQNASESQTAFIPLKTTTAFHSPKLNTTGNKLIEKLSGLKSYPKQIDIYSTVTGKLSEESDFVTPTYWGDNLRKPVLFYQALREAHDPKARNIFLEIGPKQVLTAHLDSIFTLEDVCAVPSLENDSSSNTILSSLCVLYSMGVNPKWNAIVPLFRGSHLKQPKYQFQKKQILYDPDRSKNFREGIVSDHQNHPFIKRSYGAKPTFKIDINERQTPFVYEHVIGGSSLIPGTFYIEVAMAVGAEVLNKPVQCLTVSVKYLQPLTLSQGEGYVLTCEVTEISADDCKLVVFRRNTPFASGYVEARRKPSPVVAETVSRVKPRCPKKINGDEIYQMLSSYGLQYGKGLRVIREAFSNTWECYGNIVATDIVKSQVYQTHFHPSIIDAMTQMLVSIDVPPNNPLMSGKSVLPAGVGAVKLYQTLENNMFVYGKLTETSSSKAIHNMVLLSESGSVVAEVNDFVTNVVGENRDDAEKIAYHLDWTPSPDFKRQAPNPDQVVMIISDDKSFTDVAQRHENIELYTLDDRFDIKQIQKYISHENNNVCSIIFNQGFYTADENICLRACQICENLRQLLLILSENNWSIPVTVLTKSTQAAFVEDFDKVNIYGSQLWGMVRCLFKEDIYPYLQLIDVHDFSQDSISALFGYIDFLGKSELVTKEMVIKSGNSYKSALKFSASYPAFNYYSERSLPFEDNFRVIKTSTWSNPHESFYLQPYKPKEKVQGAVEIEIGEIFLHKKTFMCSTVSSNIDLWPNLDSDDVRLMCLEAIGCNNKTSEPVIVCLPLEVTNVVSVPQECVIPRVLIPWYKPGVVTLLCLLWELHEQVSQQHNVTLIIDASPTGLVNLSVKFLLAVGNANYNVINKADIPQLNLKHPSTLLLLTELEPALYQILLQSPWVKKIIVPVGMCFGTNLECSNVQCNSENIFKISHDRIFNLKKLKVTLPNIIHLLSKQSNDIDHLFEMCGDSGLAIISDGSLRIKDNTDLKFLVKSQSIFRRNASYLVVGGLGGLGWIIVRLIAEMGGGLIVTLSRNPPSSSMQSLINDLNTSSGVKVISLQADITDMVSLRSKINYLVQNFPKMPLKGIFQAAGVLDDGFLMNISMEHFKRVCMPKIQGTHNLHRITKNMNLDYFVLNSSIVSITGNAGQSNYGAGNSFLDTLAHYRRSEGLPGQSINWGPLDVGMALKNDDIARNLNRSGFVPLNEEQIKSCLVHALFTGKTQICFMDIDWIEKQAHLYLSSDIRGGIEKGGRFSEDEQHSHSIDRQALALLSQDEREDALYQYIRDVMSKVLAVDGESLTKSTTLSSLGLDSMLAMAVTNQLRRDLNIRIPLVKLLEDSTLNVLLTSIQLYMMSGGTNEKESDNENDDSPKMSVFQEMIYKHHREYIGSDDYLFLVETQVEKVATLNWMKEVISSILYRNKQLRTVYKESESRTIPVVLENVNQLEIWSLLQGGPDRLYSEVLQSIKRPFNLSEEIPLRIISIESEAKYSMAFIFHSIAFDLVSMNLFFEEFASIFEANLKGNVLPEKPDVNVAIEVDMYLSPRKAMLKDFWISRINRDTRIPFVSFSGNGKNTTISGYFHQTVVEEIPSSTLKGIEQLLSKWRVTLFQFITSAYQLFLKFVSGEQRVGIKTVIDTRIHIPSLGNTMTRCVNGIPLIAKFRNVESIKTFVVANAREIGHCIENGAYPMDLIMENASSESTENLNRHCVVQQNLIFVQKQGLIDFNAVGNLKTNHETRLFISTGNDKDLTLLKLDYVPSLIPLKKASFILKRFTCLLEYMVANPHCLVSSIPAGTWLNESQEPNKTEPQITPTKWQNVNLPVEETPTKTAVMVTENAVRHTKGDFDTQDHHPPIISVCDANDGEGMIKRKTEVGSINLLQLTKSNIPNNCVKLGYEDGMLIATRGSFFVKETRHGLEHKVFLKLEGSGKTLSLSWGKTNDALSKTLLFNTIKKISLNQMNGFYMLILKTTSRRFCFKTTDYNLVMRWMDVLREKLCAKTDR